MTSQLLDAARTLVAEPHPFAGDDAATRRIVRALSLTIAKCIRGVADASTMRNDELGISLVTDAIRGATEPGGDYANRIARVLGQADVGIAALEFARDCEAGETSAEDLVAVMFVNAAAEVLR